jgi:hypothetical protein
MGRTRATRLAAALAALLFFGGETVVPSLDALVFHRGGAPAALIVSHVESGATTNHHADQCMLTFRLANGRVSAALGVAIRFEAMALRPAASPPTAVPLRFYPGRHQQSRAPPAPLA